MFMLKSKHLKITNALEKQVDGLRDYYRKKIDGMQQYNVQLIEQINELNGRLANAVEGLATRDVEVLQAKQQGLYIYSVFRNSELIKIVRIPMSSKNYDYMAKKAVGLKDSEMKGVKAVRWVI